MTAPPKFEQAARARVDEAIRDEQPLPLPDELEPVAPFPLDALPEGFRPWVADVSERMACPPDFVAVPLLVAAASLVARRLAIRPQARTDWVERGNLWAVLVGRPGLMKSPALNAALAPIVQLESRAAEEHTAAMHEHAVAAVTAKLRAEANLKTARAALKRDPGADVSDLVAEAEDGEPPKRRRYLVTDATYEKLGELSAENPDGLLSVRDELRSLLQHLAQEEQASARGFYLQAWSGGRYTFDRIGRGTVTIEDLRLSLIGSIQPGPLSDLVQRARRGAADDGLLERFLVAWPDAATHWREVDRWPDTAARRAVWEAFDRLASLDADLLGAERDTDSDGEPVGLPYLRFDPEAREHFAEWRAGLETRIRSTEAEGLEGALAKFRHHVPALALTLHAVGGEVGPVSTRATLGALDLADYFEGHTRRLHGSARRVGLRAARILMGRVFAGDLEDGFTAREVHRPRWSGLTDRQTIADALDALVAHNWLSEATVDTGGRPTIVYSLTSGARNHGSMVGAAD